MAAQHTPGPWTITSNSTQWHYIHSEAGIVAEVGKRSNMNVEGEANARLIAAAPETAAERDRLRALNAELVRALQEAHEEIHHPGAYAHCHKGADIVDMVEAVLKSAKAEQS